jgi:3-hydroxyisobutyrate dehydrogenase
MSNDNSGDQDGAKTVAQRIAFIGLGNMGGPMALNLHRAGHHVSAFDLSANACDHWQAQGLNIAASAVASIEGAEVVITMLPASRHVEALYLGGSDVEGLLDKIGGQTLVIDCSTIATASAKKVAAAAADRGIAMLDAPVSGGTAGAAAGTLTFMVGGADHSLARARPLLDVMGANVFHAGSAGAGQTAKICNNMLLGILMIGTSEALALGMANGLDSKALSEIMRLSSGGNWALEKYNPVPGIQPNAPASRDYSGGFGTDLMLKDLGLAMESALGTGNATPLGSLARNLYSLHSSAGHGGLDFSSIVQQFLKR